MQGFAEVLSGYDVVLDSQGGNNLERSLTVLKPGRQAIGVTGPPDPAFAKHLGAPKFMGVVMGLLSRKVRKQARKLGVRPARHGLAIGPRQRAGAHIRHVRECPFPDVPRIETAHGIEPRTARHGGFSGTCSAP